MHIYQKLILDQLRRKESHHYADLQPEGVESSHFKYHLDQLIKDGHVQRIDRGVYSLTTSGESYVDSLSSGRTIPYESPKVTTYTLLYDDENYYFYNKPNMPFKNLLNMCGGRHHVGETALQASSRELEEKTGLLTSSQRQHASVEVLIEKGNEVYTHFIVTVFSLKVESTPANLTCIKKSDINTSGSLLAPEIPKILQMIENNDFEPLISIYL